VPIVRASGGDIFLQFQNKRRKAQEYAGANIRPRDGQPTTCERARHALPGNSEHGRQAIPRLRWQIREIAEFQRSAFIVMPDSSGNSRVEMASEVARSLEKLWGDGWRGGDLIVLLRRRLLLITGIGPGSLKGPRNQRGKAKDRLGSDDCAKVASSWPSLNKSDHPAGGRNGAFVQRLLPVHFVALRQSDWLLVLGAARSRYGARFAGPPGVFKMRASVNVPPGEPG